jgi:hypothetical protein
VNAILSAVRAPLAKSYKEYLRIEWRHLSQPAFSPPDLDALKRAERCLDQIDGAFPDEDERSPIHRQFEMYRAGLLRMGGFLLAMDAQERSRRFFHGLEVLHAQWKSDDNLKGASGLLDSLASNIEFWRSRFLEACRRAGEETFRPALLDPSEHADALWTRLENQYGTGQGERERERAEGERGWTGCTRWPPPSHRGRFGPSRPARFALALSIWAMSSAIRSGSRSPSASPQATSIMVRRTWW